MPALVLHVDAFWTSPYAFAAYVGLREKGIPFEVRTHGLHTKENSAPEYVHGSLTGRVPAIQQGDWWLSESSAIVEWLEDAFPAPVHPRILPTEVRERARCRQLMAWLRSDLLPLRTERPTSSIFYVRPVLPFTPAGKKAAAHLLAVAEALLPVDRTTLFEAFCIADTDLAMMLNRLVHNGDPVPDEVRAYVTAQWARPSVRSWTERDRIPFVPY